MCGVELGRFCFVGAGAVVTRDVLPFSLVTGVPARHRGWVCECGEVLPEAKDRAYRCLACGGEYVEVDGGLMPAGVTDTP